MVRDLPSAVVALPWRHETSKNKGRTSQDDAMPLLEDTTCATGGGTDQGGESSAHLCELSHPRKASRLNKIEAIHAHMLPLAAMAA